MKKKTGFLIPLLMAIVMMAMSPQKVWAQTSVTLNSSTLKTELSNISDYFTLTFAYSAPEGATQVAALNSDNTIYLYSNGTDYTVAPTASGAEIVPSSCLSFISSNWKITSIDLTNFNTANVTNMAYMFYICPFLKSITFGSKFNTSNVTNMSAMFCGCRSLTSLDVSMFNTEKVTDMSDMFSTEYGGIKSSLTTLTLGKNFNTANVTNMSRMFNAAVALTSLDVSMFNTEKVTNMYQMFYGCQKLTSLDVSKFNTDRVTNMGSMFNDCQNVTSLDLSNFNTANVTNMQYMFSKCSALTSLDVSKFNTEKVTGMGMIGMFSGCSGLTTLDLSKFNTAAVTDMFNMFSGCTNLTTLNLSSFNTEKVTRMFYMFSGCSQLQSLDLSSFNTSNVTDMQTTFNGCSALTTIGVTDKFTTKAVTTSKNMFAGCTNLKGGNGTTYNSNYVDTTYARIDRGPTSSAPGYFTCMKHQLTEHPAVAAICKTGNTAYWSCSLCGKYFNDAEGKNEIAENSWVIKITHDDVRYDAANEKTYCESCGTTLATGTWILLDGVNITIATDYDNTGDIMFSNGTMIVKEGATITHGVSVSAGTVLINYGSINMVAYNGGGTICNHGYIKNYFNYSGENYNTGTYSSLEYPENLTTCSHTNITPLGTVEATCTKPGGSLYECSTCYYRFVPEGSQIAALGHDLPAYDNGFATCNRCGEEIMQEPQSQDGILKIANLGNLYWFLEKLEKEPDTYNSAHLELTNDIVVNDGTFDTDGNFTATNASTTSTPRAWRKCVEQDRTFYGTVDGQGHEIKGLYFNDSQSYVYLFYDLGTTDNKTATITNLGFTNVYCSAKNPPLFCHYNYGTISQCYVNGTIEGNGWSPTAFCYYNYGTISQCYTTGIRKNKGYPSASLCYHNYGTVTNSYSTCNLFGSETYGLIADNYGTITNCYFAGTLSATTNYGLCGIFKSGSSSTNCYTTYPTAYNSSNSAVHPTINTSVSAERLASGEVAYLLNGSQDAGTWRQKLSGEGVNTTPVLKQTDDNKVYYGYADCEATEKTYINIAHATQGHSITNYTYNNDATCVKNGTKTASCDYGCGATDTKDDSEHPATGNHNFVNGANCTVCDTPAPAYTLDKELLNTALENISSNFTLTFDYSAPEGATQVAALNSGNTIYLYKNTADGTAYTVAPATSGAVIKAPADCKLMFLNVFKVTNIAFNNFNTSNVTNMSLMFQSCTNLTSLDLSNFNTEKVTEMSGMFDACSVLQSLDLSGFNTSNVEDMNSMFYGCASLTSLDLSNFNTSNVENMHSMFEACEVLTTITTSSKFVTTAVTDSYDMFNGCTNLKGGKGTAYNEDHTDATYACFDGGTAAPGYFTRPPQVTLDKASLKRMLSNVIGNFTLTFAYEAPEGATRGPQLNTDKTIYLYSNGTDYTVAPAISGAEIMAPADCSQMFWGLQKLTSLTFTNFNTASVTTMRDMFITCEALTSLDLSSFNTDSVTNMIGMFNGCIALTSLNLSGFNTSKVTDMEWMFNNCLALTSLDVSMFNTDKVTNMSGMFTRCLALTSLNLSSFKTDSVTNMSSMFSQCSSLTSLDLSSFKTDSVTNMSGMFGSCEALTSLDLSNFNTSKVTDMGWMFGGCIVLTSITASDKFVTTAATASNGMFDACLSLMGGQGTTYDPEKRDKTYARLDGGTDAPGYFIAPHVNLDKSLLSTALGKISGNFTLTFAYSAPEGATQVAALNSGNTIYLYKNTADGTDYTVAPTTSGKEILAPANCRFMFFYVTNLTSLDLTNFNASRVTDMESMFNGCSALTSLDLSGLNTPNVESMYNMFLSCRNLQSLNLSGLNTAKVESMSSMFESCQSLQSLDLSSFNTENVTTMEYMFSNCEALQSLNLSSFNTEKVTTMNSMFYRCSTLTSLDLGSFNTAEVTDMGYMFNYCTSLSALTIGNFDMQKVDNISDMFGYCDALNTLTLKSVPYLKDETFNTQFSRTRKKDGEEVEVPVTINYQLSDKSTVYTNLYNNLPTTNDANTSATYGKTLADGGWYSCVLPYAFDIPEGVTVLYEPSISGNTITFKEYKNAAMSRNTPFLYKKANGGAISFNEPEAIVEPSTIIPSGVLRGTYVKIPAGEATGKLILNSTGTAFAEASETASIPAFRAYIQGAAGSNFFTIVVDDDLTGVASFDADGNVDNTPVDVYTIDGKLVRKSVDPMTALQGLENGIYVVNGKKIKK